MPTLDLGIVSRMPTGAVMYYAGLAAPDGWLACDGTVYNIADYPALAAFFAANYGANNYWGGDGTTTFGVPDWQGEFLRASGTNAHENQGSGATVGRCGCSGRTTGRSSRGAKRRLAWFWTRQAFQAA